MERTKHSIDQALFDKASFVANVATIASLAVADIEAYPDERKTILLDTVRFALEYLGEMATDVAGHLAEYMAENSKVGG